LQYTEEHPVTGFSVWKRRLSDLFHLPVQPAYAFGGIVLLLLVTGGGATFAAEGALPGDLLYPMKIYVNESVQGVLKVGDARKAKWEAEKTVRRLEEAESLATEGRLSTTTIEAIKVHVEESVSEFHVIVERARERETSEEEKEEIEHVHADFDATLDTHAQILSTMGESAMPDRNIEQNTERDEEEKGGEESSTANDESRNETRDEDRDEDGSDDTDDDDGSDRQEGSEDREDSDEERDNDNEDDDEREDDEDEDGDDREDDDEDDESSDRQNQETRTGTTNRYFPRPKYFFRSATCPA
jgi:hypothetical protein